MFKGTFNIIRFNWRFYIAATAAIVVLTGILVFLHWDHVWLIALVLAFVAYATLASIVASYVLYDASHLYDFTWLDVKNDPLAITHFTAGYDESSPQLKKLHHPDCTWTLIDFASLIDQPAHSIETATALYPLPENTVKLQTRDLKLPDNSQGLVYLVFCLHELRNNALRNELLREIKRTLKPGGHIVLIEHLRDWQNTLAYTLGVNHFLSKSRWKNSFNAAGLQITSQKRYCGLVTKYTLTHA